MKSRRAQNTDDYETWVEGEVSPTLNAFDNGNDTRATVLIFTAQRVGEPPRIYHDITPSLLSRMGTGGNNTPMIVDPLYSFDTQFGSNANVFEDQSPTLKSTQQSPTVVFQPGAMVRLGGHVWEESVPTLRAEAHGGDNQPYIATQEPVAFDGYNQSADDSGIHRTLRIGIDSGDCIAFTTEQTPKTNDDQALTLTQGSPTGGGQPQAVMQQTIVRRLTPTECERLMGWPDNHTLHRADGKTNSDSTRYKMCGNGVATPVATWIANQLKDLL